MKRVLSVVPGLHLLALIGLALAATVGSLSAADHYYVNDHLATTTAVTDAAGEIAAIEADAFGTPVAGAAQAARFTGKPYDDDIGAYVFPCRNYRSDEARWMSSDPSGFPDGVNGVRYQPSLFTEVDPTGLRLETVERFYEKITLDYISTSGLAQTVLTALAARFAPGATTASNVAAAGATAIAGAGAWGSRVLKDSQRDMKDVVGATDVSLGWVDGLPVTTTYDSYATSAEIGYTTTVKYSQLQIWGPARE